MLLNNNITLPGWTDASVAIIVSGSIQSSINASKTEGNNSILLFIIL